MKYASFLALTVAIIGAVNWGLIALFSFDLVAWLFGNMTLAARLVYGLVGVSGLYLLGFYSLLQKDHAE